MDDTGLRTRAQLDAALEEQRVRHIERLRRQANMSYLWVVALLAAQIALFFVAYQLDKKWPPVYLMGLILTSTVLGFAGLAKRRQIAARQLAHELRNSAVALPGA